VHIFRGYITTVNFRILMPLPWPLPQ